MCVGTNIYDGSYMYNCSHNRDFLPTVRQSAAIRNCKKGKDNKCDIHNMIYPKKNHILKHFPFILENNHIYTHIWYILVMSQRSLDIV